MTAEERDRGVIAALAGNHAQGPGLSRRPPWGQSSDLHAAHDPLIKVSATKSYGAEVILHGANYDDACEEAIRRGQQQHLTFIHPFDDDAVIAGRARSDLRCCSSIPKSKRWSSPSAAAV